jgi:Na+/proline symporter
VITNDIIKRTYLPHASDRTLVITARMATLAVGVIAMLLAVLFAKAKGLEDLVQYMARLFAGLLPPVALPMIAGLLSRRTSSTGALAGFLLGAACGAVGYIASYFGDLSYLRTVPYLTWITLLSTAGGLIAGSAVFPNPAEKQQIVEQFLDGLISAPRERTSLRAGGDAAVALRILGVTTALLGFILAAGVVVTAGFTAGRLSTLVGTSMFALGVLATVGSYTLKQPAGE